MPDYPKTLADAQAIATRIARTFGNYQCSACAKAIALALGRDIDATVIKLLNEKGDGTLILPSEQRHVSWSGHHVGVRIGQMIYDNHFPDGVATGEWAALYTDEDGNALTRHDRPISSFFAGIFRWKEFSNFASNRFQDEEFED